MTQNSSGEILAPAEGCGEVPLRAIVSGDRAAHPKIIPGYVPLWVIPIVGIPASIKGKD
jgi:hypothetical protein